MTLSTKNSLIALAAIIVIGLAIFAYADRAQAPSTTATSTTQSAATTTVGGVTGTGSYTVTPIPTLVAPDYKAAFNYGPNVTADVKAVAEQHRTYDISLIDKDSLNFNAWMDLATVKKIVGDFHGAEAIWIYATKEWPTSPIAFNNLVDLYTNFLHDSAKASFYAAAAAKLK